jgi:hypothetical protein
MNEIQIRNRFFTRDKLYLPRHGNSVYKQKFVKILEGPINQSVDKAQELTSQFYIYT